MLKYILALLVFKFSVEKSAIILVDLSLPVTIQFFLEAFNVLSCSVSLIYNYDIMWVSSFLVFSVWCSKNTLVFFIWMTTSFPRFENLYYIILFNMFSMPLACKSFPSMFIIYRFVFYQCPKGLALCFIFLQFFSLFSLACVSTSTTLSPDILPSI